MKSIFYTVMPFLVMMARKVWATVDLVCGLLVFLAIGVPGLILQMTGGLLVLVGTSLNPNDARIRPMVKALGRKDEREEFNKLSFAHDISQDEVVVAVIVTRADMKSYLKEYGSVGEVE